MILGNSLTKAQDFNIPDSIIVSDTQILSDFALNQDLQSLSLSFYKTKISLDRNYDYEIYNKQRRLRMWSNEIKILGFASILGIAFAGPILFPDCSLAILIPTEVALDFGIVIGSFIWSKKLNRKADALSETSVSLININENSSLCFTHYSTSNCLNVGLGIGYKYNF